MAGKSRQSANLTSKNNIFVDAVADNTGIGSTSPKSKLDVVGNARISGILTVGVSSSVTIDGNAGIVSATKLYAAGIDVSSFIAGAGYANTSGIATYAVSSGIATYASSSGISTVASGLTTTANVNTTGIITASRFVGSGSSLTGIIGLSTQWITTSAGIHTLSNVGIGTINPTEKLDIRGILSINNGFTTAINVNNGDIVGVNSLSFNDPGVNEGIHWTGGNGWKIYESPNALTNAAGNFQIVRNNSRIFTLDTNGDAEFTGDVGIGVTPQGKLHISSGTSGDCELIIEADTDDNNESDNTRILFRQDGGNDWSSIGHGINVSANQNELYFANNVTVNGGIVFLTGNTTGGYANAIERLRITPTGNVGIETTNPTSKLDVRGDVLVSGIVTAPSFVGNLTGTATTATTATTLTNDASVNTSGIVTATKFVGDGSGLSGIVAAGSGGISLQNDSNPVGTAGTINFDNNFDLEITGGIATVTLLYAPGLTTTASVNTIGIITASRFIGTFTGSFVGSGSSLTGVIGLSTQWITTSAGIHTLSKVGIGTTNPISTLEVFGNVNVAGTSGQLFSVVDNLSTGSIFSVNDISGIPSIDVNADGTIQLAPFNGNVGVGTTRPRARVDVIGTLWASNISVGVITATTFSGNVVTLVNGRTGIVSVGIVSMTDFLYQPQGVVTLSDRWDVYNAINSSGGWRIVTTSGLPAIELNWVPSASQNGTSSATWRTNFLDKVKAGDVVQWSKDGINWNSFIQPFDSYSPGSNSVGFYAGGTVPINGSMYVRYIITRATGVQALQNGQILQYDTVYSRWMPFGPYANWESTSAGINTLRSVGIGTTNPQQDIHIYNSITNADVRIQGSGGTGDWLDIFHNSSGAGVWNYGNRPLSFATNAIPRISVSGSGNVGLGTTNPLQTVQIGLNDSNVVTIDSLGELGIGTITPTSRLDVRGDVLVSGIVTAPSFVGNLTGTATTATTLTSNASVNTSGILTATKFVGDGSGLTGIVATSSGGIFLQNNNVNIGAASTINFTSNFTVESAAGIATVGINTASTITAAAFIGDGSGLTNVSGAGGASSRTTVSGITTVLVVNGIGNTEISGFKTYGLLKVGVSSASWVRLYTDSVSRSNDASRSIEVDPTTGSGVIAEVATSGISTVKMTPFIIGFNDDNPVTNKIYVSVKNLSGISTSISVNLTILKMEE